MIITCPQCRARFSVLNYLMPQGGRQVRCNSCGHLWHATPESETAQWGEQFSLDSIKKQTRPRPSFWRLLFMLPLRLLFLILGLLLTLWRVSLRLAMMGVGAASVWGGISYGCVAGPEPLRPVLDLICPELRRQRLDGASVLPRYFKKQRQSSRRRPAVRRGNP